jgi:XRE family transcriptional regulator, regulator of sulfur utilization
MPDRFATLLAFTLFLGASASCAQSNAVMSSTLFAWESIDNKTNASGSARQFFRAPTTALLQLECHVTTLNSGLASHAPHHHPEEEIVIIRQGTVEALVNGEWKRVGPGSVIFYAANVTHDLKNVGDAPAIYHVFSWRSSLTPPRTTHDDSVDSSRLSSVDPPFKKNWLAPLATDWNAAAPQTNASAGTVTRRFFASRAATADWLECHATTVGPGGSSHAPSLQIDEEVIVVEEGQVEAYLNGAWKPVSIGSVVFNAAKTTCALRNVGKTAAKYYVFTWRTRSSG